MSDGTTPLVGEQERLIGLDVVRLLAAFGVVVIHCGDKIGLAEVFGEALRRCCVPYFLAAAAFLLVREILEFGGPPRIGRRLRRLLVPYALWSLIYVGARLAKWSILGRSVGQTPLSGQFWEILLLGRAAVHLYFLPMLAVGLAIGAWLTPFLRWLEGHLLWIPWLIGAAFFLYDFCVSLPFPNGLGSAALNCSRLLISAILFLPWLFTGVLLRVLVDPGGQMAGSRTSPWIAPLGMVLFVILDLPGVAAFEIAESIHSWMLGECLLVIALTLPANWAMRSGVTPWLSYAFGVYLVHHLVIMMLSGLAEALRIPWPKVLGLPGLVGVTFVGIVGSLAAVAVMRRWSVTRRWLLGE